MCGIAGWVSYDADLTRRQDVIDAMTATMACRGPDDSGTWVRRHVALGHRRLAIIDLPGGRQPMTVSTPNGDIAMVYSGEAYNFTELKDELTKLGHTWETDSDTEVVLHGYLQWGDAVVDHLNGMYAFAIWDERDDRLVMIRDRMGIKPFYYYPTPDGVLFGSEPKAILANPLAAKVVDTDGLRELMAFTKRPGWSLWKGMEEVRPGTIVTVSREGVRTRTYWKLDAKQHTDDQETTVARVRELMTDIVNRQLVADVPRCVLLSGGLDSSAVTGLAAARLASQGEQLRTFSVDFLGQEENFKPDEMRDTADSPFVRDVASLVGSAHQDVVLNPAELTDPEVRRAVLRARDIPAGLGDMDTSLYLLFKAIRGESTVALSGESADEVFGGYRWFFDEASVNADMFPWIAFRSAMMTDRTSIYTPELMRTMDLESYLGDQYRSAVDEVEHLDGESAVEARMRTICHLHLTRFVRMLLDRKDRASMAVGLEVRVPFCDHRLVEYVYNTPWSLKTFDGREKSLLRHATKHVLPSSVAQRVKSPYPSTQDPGYAAALQQQAKEVLAEPGHAVFGLVDRSWAHRVSEVDSATMAPADRIGLDRLLDLYHWIEMYSPELQLD
ncbi:asparagine synthase [Amycolatopsis mediterranei S699]|uniref:asparagine synthase (glutamine-hydrolyzing) n=2 Tax=Amycolatopsis mediterranei TaxID=33910 RepID=A0A0H3D2I2_AMYMU|nr:asparagine synthase (glutamine-hydrolyzing) [Amycolatopsis mediterranei]ADJ43701.1 asparagine synthase [Amycolatopsis mediterranei U32]AEK40409.1 asparagine synthase [Amycolatopsis mediterranei S699]AFO75413.1 asparagine synthase [Amycolatopsis mediterranei S699]AGT82542.1 asparagine synthase [Amycolatopsis mediterranei RB]KDO10207.1 asparagine synthase [Amycolatopsis mediterranei]